MLAHQGAMSALSLNVAIASFHHRKNHKVTKSPRSGFLRYLRQLDSVECSLSRSCSSLWSPQWVQPGFDSRSFPQPMHFRMTMPGMLPRLNQNGNLTLGMKMDMY